MEKKAAVEKVYDRPKDGIVPTLLSFQNGELTVTEKDRVQYCTMMNKTTKSKEALVVVDSNIYTGPINSTETSQLTDTYICVRNKETSKVRIIPIDQAKLKNHIYVELQQKQLEEAKSKVIADEASVKKKLVKEFRGGKAARLWDDKEKMQVNVDVIKEDIDATFQDTTINEEHDDVMTETHFEYICPKFNKDAKKVDEIYDINDIVPESLLNRLDGEAKAVYAAPLESLPIKSAFLLSNLQNIKQKETNEDECLKKIKIIIYMDSLHKLLSYKAGWLKKIELSGISAKLETYLRQDFAASENRLSNKLKDKAICHYITLCLLMSEKHVVETSMLAQELGRPIKSIMQYAHVVHALPQASKTDTISLRLPSKVKALKNVQKRRKQF